MEGCPSMESLTFTLKNFMALKRSARPFRLMDNEQNLEWSSFKSFGLGSTGIEDGQPKGDILQGVLSLISFGMDCRTKSLGQMMLLPNLILFLAE